MFAVGCALAAPVLAVENATKMSPDPLLAVPPVRATPSEARRAISQGGAYFGEDKQRFDSHDTPVEVTDGLMLWVGKKRFCRVTIQDN